MGDNEAPASPKYSLLLVDDDKDNLEILERIFRREYELSSARDGEEALKILDERPIDLLLTDYRMPGMNGAALLQRVREKNPQIVRIVLTAYSDPSEVIETINRGEAYRYITKPFQPSELRLEVRQALRAYQLEKERDEYLNRLQQQNEQLRTTERQLRELNQELEARVADRTKELARANTQLETALESVTELARTDSLTGLWNRRYAFELAERELHVANRYEQPLSILMADLDHFKAVNDQYGHPFGDDVLRAIAIILKQSTRNIDLCARYGGEEFIVILPQTDLAGAMAVAERIGSRTRAHEFKTDNGEIFRLTVSMGAALYPDHGRTLDGVIEAADEALYRAKRDGRDRVEVSSVIHR